MSDIRKSLLISLTEKYLIIVIQLLSFVVYARILSPEEIGLFAVAAALVALTQVIRDFGVGSYLIQEIELTEERKRTAFTITLLIGLSFFLLMQSTAELITEFYEDDRMEEILRWLSCNFLLIPFNSVTLSLLRREMQFRVLLWINVTAAGISTIATVGLVLAEYSYMSLVWGAVLNALIVCLGGALYRRSEFFMLPTLKAWRRLLEFGSQAATAGLLNQISMNLNDLVLGKVLGFAPVAILSRAQGVMYLFQRDIMEAINNVAFPGYARAFRSGAEMEALHTRTVTALTAIAWPFYGFLALFPYEIIRILFGDQWDAAVPLVPIFCLAGAVAAMWNLNMVLLMAIGKVNLILRAVVLVQIFRITALLFCAYHFDNLMPFAVAFLLSYIFTFPVYYYYKGVAVPTLWVEKMRSLSSSLFLTITTLSVPMLLKIFSIMELVNINMYLLTILSAVIAIISWLVHLRFSVHPLKDDEILPAALKRVITRKIER